MKLKLEKPKLLADAISIISEIVSEVRIRLLEEGLSIVAVDPANVSMIIFRLPKESFSEYSSGQEVWSVNLDDLKKVLKRASSSSSIDIEQEENQLKISIFDKVKRVFNLALIEIDTEEKKERPLTYAAKVEMDSISFSQAVEDANIVADSVAFIVGDGFFMVEALGKLNSARAEFSGDEAKIKGIGRSKYSLEYLMKFIKASRISDRVVINFSDNYPLRLDFPGDMMGMGFILAPRVEDE